MGTIIVWVIVGVVVLGGLSYAGFYDRRNRRAGRGGGDVSDSALRGGARTYADPNVQAPPGSASGPIGPG